MRSDFGFTYNATRVTDSFIHHNVLEKMQIKGKTQEVVGPMEVEREFYKRLPTSSEGVRF
jgi:hypothetical protein